MQIQQSHFMTSDMFAVAFTALTMWMGVEVALSGRSGATQAATLRGRVWIFAALFGVFGAMALASRINLAPLLGLILVAAFIAVSRARGRVVEGVRDLLAVDWRVVLALCAPRSSR
jgi:4-amino-4-deoxy-L-arabinose transferase-like glycosyltransferase